MNILQLTTSLSFAGAEQVILDICSMPQHNFIIAALQEGDASFAKKAKEKGLKVVDLKMKNKLDLGVFTRLKELIRTEKIDIVHSHLVHANFVGRISATATNTPVVSTIHIVEKRFRPSHKWMEQLTASKAHKITAVSQCVLEHMSKNIKLPQAKIELISNGIDTDRFAMSKQQRDIDILFLGRLDKQKGFDQLIPHLNKMNNINDLNICIVGLGPEEENLKQLCAEYGLNLNWQGFSEKPEDYFSRTKICVVPSRWEGFGLVAAEALSSGCQVIHSGVDSLCSVTGKHAEVFSEEQKLWGKQLQDMLVNFKINTEGRQWIIDNFSKQQMQNNYERLYHSCVASAD